VNCALTTVPVAIRVRMRLTLTTDEVSPILDVFTGSVSQDLCNAVLSGVGSQSFSCSQVVVRSVKPGSIFVEFDLLPLIDAKYISAYQAFQTLVDDLHSPHSFLLNNGTYTRFIDVNWPFQATSYQTLECDNGRLQITCPNKRTTSQQEASTATSSSSDTLSTMFSTPTRIAIMAAIVGAGVLLLILVFVLAHRRRKQKDLSTRHAREASVALSELRTFRVPALKRIDSQTGITANGEH